jgi:hypothetical protein
VGENINRLLKKTVFLLFFIFSFDDMSPVQHPSMPRKKLFTDVYNLDKRRGKTLDPETGETKENPWHKFCKSYQKEHNVSYAAAISLAGPDWKAYKEKNGLEYRKRASSSSVSGVESSAGEPKKKLKREESSSEDENEEMSQSVSPPKRRKSSKSYGGESRSLSSSHSSRQNYEVRMREDKGFAPNPNPIPKKRVVEKKYSRGKDVGKRMREEEEESSEEEGGRGARNKPRKQPYPKQRKLNGGDKREREREREESAPPPPTAAAAPYKEEEEEEGESREERNERYRREDEEDSMNYR